jgi:tRNA dimethylallyltransferase
VAAETVAHPHEVGPIIALMGPTAAGKTDLALDWAKKFPVEIVSVDSAMIYRGMDIGTGKPEPEVLRQIPHHLVDIREPSESYSAGQFVRDAKVCIADIRSRGKVPLLVGGTMMYFRSLIQGIAELPEGDVTVRTVIDQEAAQKSWPSMHAELAQIDPQAAKRIMPNDAQRIQRALEVYRITGQTLSALHAQQSQQGSERYFALAWSPADRAVLHQRIEARFMQMVQAGFLDEVRWLHARDDFEAKLPAFRSVGYRQLLAHVEGKETLEVAVERGIIATRQLARRQLIWLRGMPDVRWYDSGDPASLMRITSDVGAEMNLSWCVNRT